MFGFIKNRRRSRIRNSPFPPRWVGILNANVGLYSRLPAADKAELHGHILIFNAEKCYEGCAGLVITDEIKLTIAAQACILLLHRRTDYYPGLETIIVYPEAYVVTHYEEVELGIVCEDDETRLGESWHRGTIVLSWDDVRKGAFDIHDGENVVLHEFAHQLDTMNGQGDSTPVLQTRSNFIIWARTLERDYQKFREQVVARTPTILNPYGAVSTAEFFAVATECFFEKPRQLKANYPELYEQLKIFYQQDPSTYQTS